MQNVFYNILSKNADILAKHFTFTNLDKVFMVMQSRVFYFSFLINQHFFSVFIHVGNPVYFGDKQCFQSLNIRPGKNFAHPKIQSFPGRLNGFIEITFCNFSDLKKLWFIQPPQIW